MEVPSNLAPRRLSSWGWCVPTGSGWDAHAPKSRLGVLTLNVRLGVVRQEAS